VKTRLDELMHDSKLSLGRHMPNQKVLTLEIALGQKGTYAICSK
jgi:hypothetical protein